MLIGMLIVFMVKDFFFTKPDNTNPYALELKNVRTGDTTKPAYNETGQIKSSLNEIHGIATDQFGRIYIAGNEGVEIFESTGEIIKTLKIKGVARCIAIGEQDKIFLGMEDFVNVLDFNGNQLAKWPSFGEDAVLTSLALKGNDVFVADAGQKVVYRCDKSGNLISKIGLKDPATGVPGFIVPSPYFDLALSKDGYLWVANTGRHQLEKYDFEGKLLQTWGKASMGMEGFCGCCNPSNFCFLNDSLFVTSEKAIERIKVYNANGSFRCVVAKPDQFEEGTKGLDLAVDKQNRILVLDPLKMCIRIFEPKKQHS